MYHDVLLLGQVLDLSTDRLYIQTTTHDRGCCNVKKTRKTNSVVRKDITEALFQLMAEKHIDSITVTELVERAGVARVSFYRNFSSMDDVLRQDAQRVTEEWLERLDPKLCEQDSRGFVRELLQHALDERDVTELLLKSDRADILRAEFNRAFGVGCEDRKESARRAFLAGGFYNLSYRWALAGYDPDPDTMADFVHELVFKKPGTAVDGTLSQVDVEED